MRSAHRMLTLLSCSASMRLVEVSVTSMRKFPTSFNWAWHDVPSFISYSIQTKRKSFRRSDTIYNIQDYWAEITCAASAGGRVSHACRDVRHLLYVSHADTTLSIVPLVDVTACVASSASLSASFTWRTTSWDSPPGEWGVCECIYQQSALHPSKWARASEFIYLIPSAPLLV